MEIQELLQIANELPINNAIAKLLTAIVDQHREDKP
jgi:hypothetical protein